MHVSVCVHELCLRQKQDKFGKSYDECTGKSGSVAGWVGAEACCDQAVAKCFAGLSRIVVRGWDHQCSWQALSIGGVW